MPPPTQLTLSALLVQQTQAAIYQAILNAATLLDLPVTSWTAGDPTRSLFYVESALIEALESVVVGYVQSGFLDYAAVPVTNADGSTSTNPWLSILAYEVFGVTVPEATYATTTVTLTNAGGGQYVLDAGDLTLQNSTTGATYTSTTPITLTPVGTSGATGTVTVVANQAGGAGNAGATEIDTLVTAFLGVTCSNAAAAIGVDEQDPQTTVAQCRDKLGSLSPNGPSAAYSYVALNSALTGVTSVTQARTYPDSATGDVLVYVCGPGGATISGGDITAVTNAILQWATPLCITPTVLSATGVTVAVTYTLTVYQSVNQTTAQVEAAVLAALEALFANQPIGGNVIPPASTGIMAQSMIEAAIGGVFPTETVDVVVSLPAGDTTLTAGQVAALGTVTPTITFIAVPS